MEISWKLHCQVVATHAPTHSGIPIAGEIEKKKELKNLYTMVDSKIVTYLKNKK